VPGDRSGLGLATEPGSDKNRSHSLAADASASGEDVAMQLRRRRAASHRLPPLPDGRRDPLDRPGRS